MWLAVDESGDEWVYSLKPDRLECSWDVATSTEMVRLPEGTIKKIIGKTITWEDEAYYEKVY